MQPPRHEKAWFANGQANRRFLLFANPPMPMNSTVTVTLKPSSPQRARCHGLHLQVSGHSPYGA